MGNYKEGQIFVKIKKDIPSSIKEILFKLYEKSESEDLNIELLEAINNISKNDVDVNFELLLNNGFLFLYKDLNIISKEHEENSFIKLKDYVLHKKYNEINDEDVFDHKVSLDKQLKEFMLPEEFYIGFIICSKIYNNEFETIINWLQPYFSENQENFIGEIHDENNTFNKFYYVNFNNFLIEKSKCNHICNGCDLNKEDHMCNHYKYCERAYNLKN